MKGRSAMGWAGRVALLAMVVAAIWLWRDWQGPKRQQAPVVSEVSVTTVEPRMPPPAPDYDAIVNQMLREAAESERQSAAPPRQTDFNDRNYVARAPDNIMESAHVPTAPARAERRARSGGELTGSGDARFEWVDARRKRSRWQTRYEYRNGVINNSSFCRNYRRGSIEYRTCRKGARAWLAERCGDGTRLASARQRMYCHAHSGFRL